MKTAFDPETRDITPRFYTAEAVLRGHPDKLCDLIADTVLDECLRYDPASRVACEVMATRGHIIVAGEITTTAMPDVFNIKKSFAPLGAYRRCRLWLCLESKRRAITRSCPIIT